MVRDRLPCCAKVVQARSRVNPLRIRARARHTQEKRGRAEALPRCSSWEMRKRCYCFFAGSCPAGC